ncbi:MAG: hypothetical protein COV57_00685 [Candidatus Liptonbacteria bacterium CG11_big_fil_rev_8_21_14_0_20_35_14]|uniref:Uncharacterized protein n=1 Tax=Candidatus Liptonbacteria bacterium CG11_big_fil_rev_8_21_14_0_20_35_14 TaxID=1974634 RepID=A0A2H0N8F2_9BACT|nr:MAG: hypothetical protein COV57_00685 [Candidatus Liptonbacteria bacterium CG11_big_fil_rev_8_21_14_0_20_35_14]
MLENHILSFEYNQIDESLFIGTNICCLVHFKQELLDKGITADISLEADKLDLPFGVESYLWLPTPNNQISKPNQLDLGVRHIEQLVNQNRKIYVHCQFGHGRGPSLIAAYYIYKGLSVDEAIAKIKSKRPSVHLKQNQYQGLKDFQSKLNT